MAELKPYKCVNCGEASAALYRTYGPTVLKLNKCENCKGVVDKYIEYDPVIVMIDLVLMSREAQRHVLYNTEFKSYWKLLVILIMLETYGVWRSDSLFNIVIYSLCGIQSNSIINSTVLALPVNMSVSLECEWLSGWWNESCTSWAREEGSDDTDLFIWEKDFYIHFISTFAGIAVFILTVQSLMKIMQRLSHNNVPVTRVLKAFSLAYVSILFTLPMLVWGNTETSPETRIIHYVLVFAYSFVVYLNVFTVLYECGGTMTIFILISSNIMKYLTSFLVTPSLRTLVT